MPQRHRPPSLLELALTMRKALTVTLQASLRHQRTDGVCAIGSILVQDALRHFTNHPGVIRGGSGDGSGVRDLEGNWKGHYWVEVDVDGVPTVVDITADQFGWPEIVVEPLTAVADRYKSEDHPLVEGHIARVREWLAASEDDEQALRAGCA